MWKDPPWKAQVRSPEASALLSKGEIQRYVEVRCEDLKRV
jgi:hypothetical protein